MGNNSELNLIEDQTIDNPGVKVAVSPSKSAPVRDEDDDFEDELESDGPRGRIDMFSGPDDLDKSLDKIIIGEEVEDDLDLDTIDNILDLPENQYPRFTLAKNKARFLRMVSWYRQKEEWIEVAPVSGVAKTFKQQTKELEGIRSSKLDYEMELKLGL